MLFFALAPLLALLPLVPHAPPRVYAPHMAAATEVYSTYVSSQPIVRQKIKDVGPSAAQGGLAGLVAAAAAVGYVVTPSSRLVVNAIGGVGAGALGMLARKRLAEERRETAVTAAAALLARGLGSVTPEEIESLAEQYGVSRSRFNKQLAELFLVYLSACLEEPQILTSELSELLSLKRLLRLSPAAVGTQVYAAGRALYSRHRAYLEDTEPSDSKRILTKYIFLAERLISVDESAEGYRYEAMRAQRLFGLSAEEWVERAESCALPFYEKTLSSAVLNDLPATPEQLSSVRASLGVSTATADRLHAEVYSRLARELLQPEVGTAAALSAEDAARLAAAADLLGLSDETTAAELAKLTEPLYESAITESLVQLQATPAAEAAEVAATVRRTLVARQQELALGTETTAALERKVMRAKAADMLSGAAQSLRVQNSEQALATVDEVVSFCEKTGALTADANVYADVGVFALRDADVLSLYRLQLLTCLNDMKVDDADETKLAALRHIFGLSKVSAARVYEAAAGPMLRRAIEDAVSGALSAEAQKKLEDSRRDLALPESVAAGIAVEAYSRKLGVMTPEGAILSEDQSTELNQLREFLGLSISQVFAVHKEFCSPAYRKSVREVFETDGKVPDEYWEGLVKLRQRLVLSNEVAEELFADEAQAKMVHFGKKALEALEKSTTNEKDPQIDIADEASVAMRALELVNFCVNARVLVPQMVEEELADGNKTMVETDVYTVGTSLKGRFESRQLADLYREYLVEAFQGSDQDKNALLFGNLKRLSLVLGLENDIIRTVHNELGATIYRRYLGRVLMDGGDIGPAELAFLDTIRETLDLPRKRCDELVREMKLTRVATLIEAMFDSSNLNPKEIRKCVAAAELFDVDLSNDLSVPKARLEKMFIIEMEDLIETGELTVDNTDALIESCEAFHVSEERATELVEASVSKRCAGGVLQATACLRRGSMVETVNALKRTLKYAYLSPTAVEVPMVSDKEKGELYMVFQSQLMADGADDADSQADLNLLKTVVGLAKEE